MSKDNSSLVAINEKRLISVVIPVFGNSGSIDETCRQILEVRGESFPHLDIEVVFVDDGSKDGSWKELERVKADNPRQVSLLKLSRNFGQISAILAGYEAARGDAIITVSADLQDPIALMARMVSFWEGGQEIVIANRESRNDDVTPTYFSKIAYYFARRANPLIPKGGFDYLLLSRRATTILRSFKGRHRFFQGDVLWVGLPTTFIPYVREKRKHGKSGWTFAKKFKYFTDLMLDSSYFPIRAMSGFGFLTASAGILYAIVIVIAWFRGETPFEGWAPIMITLLVIGGLIMMMLGMIGEYLWRIYDDVKQRPLFIVETHLPASDMPSSQPSNMPERHAEE